MVVVVSRFVSLIQDQMERLRQLGIASVSLSDVKTEEDDKRIENGCYSVVYATPKSLLKNKR